MNELPYITVDQKIDTQALQGGTLEELRQLKEAFGQLLGSRQGAAMMTHLTNATAMLQNLPNKDRYQLIVRQLAGLPEFIDSWITMAVDSPERFQFFVKAKAEDVRSGNDQKDYYWALAIRYDQLVALVRVLQRIYQELKRWLSLGAREILSDPVFIGFLDTSPEDQIYLEAEHIYGERVALTQ